MIYERTLFIITSIIMLKEKPSEEGFIRQTTHLLSFSSK